MFTENMMLRAEVALPNMAAHGMSQDDLDSQNVLQNLINQISTQLIQSDIYRRAVDSLQQLTAEGGIDCQILLKAVSLEAIRLTVETVTADRSAVPQSLNLVADPMVTAVGATDAATDAVTDTVAELNRAELNPAVSDRAVSDQADSAMFEAIAMVMQPAKPSTNPVQAMLSKYRAKRRAEAVEELILTREDILSQIGERIQQEREAKKMSIAQLHARTFIPMYHLQALEGGHIEQLPEDVYLRGFIRRIENALSLTPGCLVEAMPHVENVEIVPSWCQQSVKAKRKNFAGLDVNPTHLYFTYAALMAGGVCWLSNQATPHSNLPDLNYEPRAQNPMPKDATANNGVANRANDGTAKAKLVSHSRHPNAPQTTIATNLKASVSAPETVRPD